MSKSDNQASMTGNYSFAEFDTQTSLAEVLADDVVAQLNNSISENGMAVMALSGGSTPKPLFQELCKRTVDWTRVVITLVDERWVDEQHELSNAAFLKRYLLDELPGKPQFVSLYHPAADVAFSLPPVLEAYCAATGSSLSDPSGFDVVVLGMGGDGHTASFFPDADNIRELLDLHCSAALLTCDSPTTQVPRVTWSLPMILNTSLLALHITGPGKKAVFEHAVAGGDSSELPIRAAIFQPTTLLNVYYAD
ncbi:MAG: 6-phosphogluconolactonase [Gammaproteobacteria bacterium]|nr:6-phosphogluconolactonase [Gammaproteobacteria bacterium]